MHFECDELVYVHQRYKEVHDLVHILLDEFPGIEIMEEIIIKYFEMVHYGLPVRIIRVVL